MKMAVICIELKKKIIQKTMGKAERKFDIAENNICIWCQHRIVIFASKVMKNKFTGPRRCPEVGHTGYGKK